MTHPQWDHNIKRLASSIRRAKINTLKGKQVSTRKDVNSGNCRKKPELRVSKCKCQRITHLFITQSIRLCIAIACVKPRSPSYIYSLYFTVFQMDLPSVTRALAGGGDSSHTFQLYFSIQVIVYFTLFYWFFGEITCRNFRFILNDQPQLRPIELSQNRQRAISVYSSYS